MKFIIPLSAAALLLSSSVQAEPNLYTVIPLSKDQVIFNRFEQTRPGRFEMTESFPVRLIDGPWNPDGVRVKIDANSLAREQLSRMNHPKRSSMNLAVKESAVEKIIDMYDLDVKREDPCAATMDRTECILTEPIYSFSARVKHEF